MTNPTKPIAFTGNVYRCPTCKALFRTVEAYADHCTEEGRRTFEEFGPVVGGTVSYGPSTVGVLKDVNPCNGRCIVNAVRLKEDDGGKGFTVRGEVCWMSRPFGAIDTATARDTIRRSFGNNLGWLLNDVSGYRPYTPRRRDAKDVLDSGAVPPLVETRILYKCPVCGSAYDDEREASRHMAVCVSERSDRLRAMAGRYIVQRGDYSLTAYRIVEVNIHSQDMLARRFGISRASTGSMALSVRETPVTFDYQDTVSEEDAFRTIRETAGAWLEEIMDAVLGREDSEPAAQEPKSIGA